MKKIWVGIVCFICCYMTIIADTVRFAENENYGYILFEDSIYFNNDKAYIVKFDRYQSVIIIDSINCFLFPQLSDTSIISFIDYAEDSSRLITLTITPKLKYDTILIYSQDCSIRSYPPPIKGVYCMRDYKYLARDSLLFRQLSLGSFDVLEVWKLYSKDSIKLMNTFYTADYQVTYDFSHVLLNYLNMGLMYNITDGPLSFIHHADLTTLHEIELFESDLICSNLRVKKINEPIYFLGKEYSTQNQNLYNFVNDSVMQLTFNSYPEIVRDYYLFRDSISYTTAFTFYRCCDADTGIQKHMLVE